MTRGVPGVEVVNLAPAQTGCLHDFQPTTSEMIRMTQADVIVINGLGMETFLDKISRHAPRAQIINASEDIHPIVCGSETNAHVWLNPSLAARQVRHIATRLAVLDAARGPTYLAQADVYGKKLEVLAEKMRGILQPFANRDIITFHEAFPYFAQAFNLRVAAVIEREPGCEPSAREMADLVRLIKKTGIKAIFAEPQYPAKSAETLTRETGARIFLLDPIVSGPTDPEAYLRLMEQNLKVLAEALQ